MSEGSRRQDRSAGDDPAPLWIGITGNIACGKSTVLRLLTEVGFVGIDADAVYADLTGPGSPLVRTIAERFGPEVVSAEGGLDRKRLAAIVFSDPAALADLDLIVRGPVVAEIERRARRAGPRVAIDAVKLIESGLAERCDEVWLVACDPEVQLERLVARNRLDRAEARRRIKAQAPVAGKLGAVDRIIDNSGSLAETERQVGQALASMSERRI